MALDENYERVVLVDADLRRPVLGEVLGIDQVIGLSDVISHDLPVVEALAPSPDNPRLKILPAGTIPPNPTELLNSQRMDRVIAELRQYADKIIFDGPPVMVADASVLANKVDAVLLVGRPGSSARAAVTGMREQMSRVGASVLGVVLNSVRRRGGYYTSNYNNGKQQRGKKRTAAKQQDARPEGV